MPLQYRLPDGFTVTARGEADSTWNGFPVPILDLTAYCELQLHFVDLTELDTYRAEYVNDGKVTEGFYCDGLQWEIVQ